MKSYTGFNGNCRYFNGNTPNICNLCREGFRIYNDVCEACSYSCMTYDSANKDGSEKCLQAKRGFYLNASYSLV